MKKLLGISALALALVAVSAPRASAWCNFNFSAGMSLSFQCGKNSCPWNGPMGYPSDGGGWGGPAYGYDPGYASYPGYGGYAATPAQAQGWVAPPPTTQEPPAKKENKGDSDQVRTSSWSSYYQPAAYPQASYPAAGNGYGASAPGYSYGSYYPYSGYSYGQAPSYWYGQ